MHTNKLGRWTLFAFPIFLILFASDVLVCSAEDGLRRGLVAYWPLDEVAEEKVGELPLRAERRGVHPVSGVSGKAIQSAESDAGHAGLFFHPQTDASFGDLKAFTLSTWYRIDSMGGPGEKSAFRHPSGALGWYNPDDRSRYYFLTTYRQRGLGTTQKTSLGAGLSTRLGVWYHVVQRVDDRGNHEVWHTAIDSPGHSQGVRASQVIDGFDGIAFASGQNDWPLALAYYEAKGARGGGKVSADDVALWRRALTDDEIERLFLLGRAGHPVTSALPLKQLKKEAGLVDLPPLRDFGWTSPWALVQASTPRSALLQSTVKSTGEMAIAASDVVVMERRFPAVSSGELKVEFRVRPRHVTVEVNSPGASVMKVYLHASDRAGSWTMRWHYPWAWPGIGGNTVPRFYVIDGRGSKRKGLEYTDILIESKTWYTVSTLLDLDRKTWEFRVNGEKFDSQVNLGRTQMRWWKTDAQKVDSLRILSTGWNWIDSFRIYHDDRLIAKSDFTAEEGYVVDQSIFSFVQTRHAKK